MTNEDMLARLMAQAQGEGSDLVTLRAIVEEASDVGAARVLVRLKLSDDQAQDDLAEVRQLLRAWRAARKSVWKAVIDWLVHGVLVLVLVGLAYRLGLPELVR